MSEEQTFKPKSPWPAPPAAPSVQTDSGSETLPTSKEAVPEGQMTLLLCPFCGYTLSNYDAVAVAGIHDKDPSCILAGFKVVGWDGPERWNRRASNLATRVTTDGGSSVSLPNSSGQKREEELERVTKCLAKANAGFEEYERKFYLKQDELEAAEAQLEQLRRELEERKK